MSTPPVVSVYIRYARLSRPVNGSALSRVHRHRVELYPVLRAQVLRQPVRPQTSTPEPRPCCPRGPEAAGAVEDLAEAAAGAREDSVDEALVLLPVAPGGQRS